MPELINQFESIEIQTRNHHLTKCFGMVKDGLLCEFGVFRGNSIRQIADYFKDRPVYGFDTFTGLPEPWVRSETDTYKIGHFKCRMPKVQRNVELIEGEISETIPGFLKHNSDQAAALLHIDTDLYSSAKTVLELFNAYIVPGTVICFDELHDMNWHTGDDPKYKFWREGEYKALLEWCDKYQRQVRPYGRADCGAGSVIVDI